MRIEPRDASGRRLTRVEVDERTRPARVRLPEIQHDAYLQWDGALDDASTSGDSPWSAIDLSGSLAEASRRVLLEVERRKIVEALKAGSGNVGIAAEILQVNYKVLTAKIRELGLQ